MTTDQATETARKYLRENSRHLRTALAVHDAWFLVRDEVCKRFLEHLRAAVEDRLRRELPGADCHVRCHYGGEKRYSNTLWIFRDAWMQYEEPGYQDGRTTIRLEAGAIGPNGWYWGVCSPKRRSKMTEPEVERRNKLGATLRERGLRLGRKSDDWWIQWKWPERYVDWHPLAPDLHKECDQAGGTITTYFADNLLNIADKAIPAINEVEVRS